MNNRLRTVLFVFALAWAAAGLAQAPADAGKAELNLKGVDISVLIQTVSEVTGRSFIVDPKVTGNVTVISSTPMTTDEIWTLFTSVLSVHGYAVTPAGKAWKVLPEAAAVLDGQGAAADGPDAIVTRVVELRNVPAGELSALLQRLISPNGRISAQGSRLIVTERAANVARLMRIIARIDTTFGSEVEVIALDHANAAEVVRTLQQLEGTVAAGSVGNVSHMVADARSNSILLSGSPGQRLRIRTLVAQLDTPLTDGDYTQVIYLHNAKASELAPVLEAVAATLTGGDAKQGGGKVATIGFHAGTNALVITAPPAVFRGLASVVRQLDVRRAQVMVEAVIAEVSDDLADELGVQWQATSADGAPGHGLIGGTNFPGRGGVGGILGVMANPGSVGPGLNLGYARGMLRIPGPNGTSIDVLQIGALVRALRGDGRANILSRPSIITLDNQVAEFKVAQEVPFLTGSYTSATGANAGNGFSSPFQTIERKDVGLILKVTPHVNAGDSVRLEIVQEVSSLAPTQSVGAVDLITNKREIRTTVQVGDGALLVLGGLSSEEVSESVQGVPGLSRIPLFGGLFKSRQATRTKRNLMIFLRPVILRDDMAGELLSNDKYNFLRMEQLQSAERYDRPVRGGGPLVLPENPPGSPPPVPAAVPEARP
ncbi:MULTISPECIES: type II secretion system secretin GspD [unclassified Rhodanobacter]|uniref:type II secretion system secretin GspD n=1 Tax=unclassified Rhodanobacter TaxID=2621553 RepID=UPI001BDF2AEE|nr:MULTISPECIES: type II secretion system secretin GspD [unclassified Rhodanobacter]MBT2143645.1 type II secretion system secretin GspD [Rhodanobacter sp. LX-99]MBT2147281.1 type II secretion system secretin GspD [Rhodanobacter sp. LX-100]